MPIKRVGILLLVIVGAWFVLALTQIDQRFFGLIRAGLLYVAEAGRQTHISIVGADDMEGVDVLVLQSTIEVLEQENMQLREMLEFSDRFGFSGIGGHVVARTFDPIREELVLDRGLVDGVVHGAPVVVADGVLVGVVSHVEEKRSVVRLLIDPVSRVAGRLLNTDQTEGVVGGGHGIVVRMELIPRDENVTEGMVLVSSGLDELIPRGLLIGEVIAVESDTNSLFLRAIVSPPVDYNTLTHVLIGTSAI